MRRPTSLMPSPQEVGGCELRVTCPKCPGTAACCAPVFTSTAKKQFSPRLLAPPCADGSLLIRTTREATSTRAQNPDGSIVEVVKPFKSGWVRLQGCRQLPAAPHTPRCALPAPSSVQTADSSPADRHALRLWPRHRMCSMIQGWNKACFRGGYTEARIKLPGNSFHSGLWPAFWALGNLGRAGYTATTEGRLMGGWSGRMIPVQRCCITAAVSCSN